MCREAFADRDGGYICEGCHVEGVRFIEPPFCSRCGLKFRGEVTESFTCSNCDEVELHFESARAAVGFTPLIQEVIHRYKYNRAVWFEPFLSRILNEAALKTVSSDTHDLIVPIPLHPLKLRQREFNQAARLARSLEVATGIPMREKLVSRMRDTRTQTTLSRKERAANMKNAFAWSARNPLKGERVVLVDDIMTTGATANSCAKILQQNGAGSVTVWTVARGGPK
ncbi:MAG: ComF family protein [Verrucomicrobiales bacterium]|jgi:competence protein ComFC|nr:ComF family protein [Verrucomicrobiales bacterium]